MKNSFFKLKSYNLYLIFKINKINNKNKKIYHLKENNNFKK